MEQNPFTVFFISKMVDTADMENDGELRTVLAERVKQQHIPEQFAQVRDQFFQASTPTNLRALTSLLEQSGTLRISTEKRQWIDVDEETQDVLIARAAHTNMWPMGTHWWARDNAFIAARLIEVGRLNQQPELIQQGKRMLLSTLTILSSVSQLNRFKQILKTNDRAYRSDPHNWTHIFLGIEKNLNAAVVEPWAHKQDAWQIAAYYVLSFLRDGTLQPTELTAKQREFLGLIAPFLAAVEYWQQENSGSWEEITALRTSVLAWETSVLALLQELGNKPEFAFLQESFNTFRQHVPAPYNAMEYAQALPQLLQAGVAVALNQMPFESPGYATDDPRYRETDAALIYLLLLDYPTFIARQAGTSEAEANAIENKILQQIERLIDGRSGAVRRYLDDSYQGVGFFRGETVQKLNELYGAPSGDASGVGHFTGRREIVPAGPEAAWVHPAWQLVWWSARRWSETKDERYKALHEKYLRSALNLVTPDNAVSIEVDPSGKPRVIDIEPLRFSECYLTEYDPQGGEFMFVSPHTPLNWAVAEALLGLAYTAKVIE